MNRIHHFTRNCLVWPDAWVPERSDWLELQTSSLLNYRRHSQRVSHFYYLKFELQRVCLCEWEEGRLIILLLDGQFSRGIRGYLIDFKQITVKNHDNILQLDYFVVVYTSVMQFYKFEDKQSREPEESREHFIEFSSKLEGTCCRWIGLCKCWLLCARLKVNALMSAKYPQVNIHSCTHQPNECWRKKKNQKKKKERTMPSCAYASLLESGTYAICMSLPVFRHALVWCRMILWEMRIWASGNFVFAWKTKDTVTADDDSRKKWKQTHAHTLNWTQAVLSTWRYTITPLAKV